MDFPLDGLLDEPACYEYLVKLLHPQGLACPDCGDREHPIVHRRCRAPVLDYRCGVCGRVYNAWSGTLLSKTRYRPSEWVLLLRGVCQGTTTARLARELDRNRPHLLELRHRMQAWAQRAGPLQPLPDRRVEADEAYQNAGEKRHSAPRPRRPAAAPRPEVPRPRHLRARSAAGGGNHRPGEPRLAPGGDA